GTPTLNTTSIGRNNFALDVPALALNQIKINVTGSPASLRWNNSLSGTGDGVSWEASTGTTRQNWLNPASWPAVADFFYNNDSVTFNDANNGKYNVNVVGLVNPGNMTVDNNSGNYSMTGTGTIAGGGTLTKTGTSALTIATSANSWSGGLALNAGTLNIGS